MSAKHTALRRVSRRELFYLPLVTAIPALAQRRTADTPAGDVSLYQGVLLNELQARACRYFIEQSHSETGLVRDRVRVEGPDDRRVASIAATGFGLSALCIADRKRITPKGEAANRVLTTLRFLARTADHRNGFFPHFLDAYTGERIWRSEFSSVDTAWALCGVLHCRVHFSHPEIRALADELLGRADWRWMLAGGQTLSHGWTPEHGFLPYRWDSYSELMAMYLLAWDPRPPRFRPPVGTPGPGRCRTGMGARTSGPTRLYLRISIRTPGSTFGTIGINTPTISPTRRKRLLSTGTSARNWRRSIRGTANRSGESPLPIHGRAT